MVSTKIQNLPIKAPIGSMKIPTGGFGDYSITVNGFAEFIIDAFNIATTNYVDNIVADKEDRILTTGGNLSPVSQLSEVPDTNNEVIDEVAQALLDRIEYVKDNFSHNELLGRVQTLEDKTSNIDNTSDLDKPISNATQAALNAKADKVDVDAKLDIKADKDKVVSSLNGQVGGVVLNQSDLVELGEDFSTTPIFQDVPKLTNPDGSSIPEFDSQIQPLVNSLAVHRQGLTPTFDQAFADKIGGYPLNARIMLSNGDIVRSTVANNTSNPNVNMKGWVKTNAASQIFDESGLSQQQLNNGVESIADLLAIPNPKNGNRVYVKSYHVGLGKGGQYFVFDSSKESINDGIKVINGWVSGEDPTVISAQKAGCVGIGDHTSFLDHEGLRRIATYITNQYAAGERKFTVNFEKGSYVCQKEVAPTSYFRTFAESSFKLVNLPELDLTLNFENAEFVTRNGMRVGSFNRSNMSKYTGSSPFYGNDDTVFFTPNHPFYISNVHSLTVTGNSAFNGNVYNHIVGGVYSDNGIQWASIGFFMTEMDELNITGIHLSHSHSNDGFYIAGRNPSATKEVLTEGRYMNISGLVATKNGRNGISFTGGKNSSWYNCLSFNNGLNDHPTASNPRSNLDIEGEVSAIRRARFYNFKSSQAGADGVVSAYQDAKDVIFYDSSFINSQRALWIERPQFKFYNCQINGSMISGYYTTIEEDRTQFIDCTFDESLEIDPNVSTTRQYLIQLSSKNPIFNNCKFHIRHGGSVWSYPKDGRYPTFKDCEMTFYKQITDAMYGVYEFDGFTIHDKRPSPTDILYLAISNSIFNNFIVKCETATSGARIDGNNTFESFAQGENAYTKQVLSNANLDRRTNSIELIPRYSDAYFVSDSDYIRVMYADTINNLRKNTVLYKKGDTVHCTDPIAQSGIQKWVCTNQGYLNTTAWAATISYTVDTYINSNNKVYKCTVAGISGSTAPSHTSGTTTDGTVTWEYIGSLAVFTSYT